MLPGAGLYLPETLSRPPGARRSEDDNGQQQHSERRNSSRCLDARLESIVERSSEDVTDAFSSLATAFSFADYASSQTKVSSQNKDFISLLQRVRQDAKEASRLYTSHAVTDFLESWPDKKVWVDGILRDIQLAIHDIGISIETARASGNEHGTAGLRRKFDWTISHHKRLSSKQSYLETCHRSLMSAIDVMQAAEMKSTADPIYEMPAPVLVEVYTKQSWMAKHRNSSMPSVVISEPDEGAMRHNGTKFHSLLKQKADMQVTAPLQHPLAELPGSMPGDLETFQSFSEPRHISSDDILLASTQFPNPRLFQHRADNNADSQPSTADRQALQRKPQEPYVSRSSFDNTSPSIGVFDDRAETSPIKSRPRVYSDQVRSHSFPEVKTRTSLDQELPTVVERLVEGQGSDSDTGNISQSRRRYRQRANIARGLATKHHSLPSALPYFPSRTSLMDDLSQWTVAPHPNRESYHTSKCFKTNVSVDTSVPITSVTSSPVNKNSHALDNTIDTRSAVATRLYKENALSAGESMTMESLGPALASCSPPPENVNKDLVNSGGGSQPILEKVPFTLVRRPVPVTIRASKTTHGVGKETSQSVTASAFPRDIAEPALNNDMSVHEIQSPGNAEHTDHSSHAPVRHPESTPLECPDPTTAATMPASLRLVDLSKPKMTEKPTPLSPPMTAQAKRRAAHARRMHSMFAPDAGNA